MLKFFPNILLTYILSIFVISSAFAAEGSMTADDYFKKGQEVVAKGVSYRIEVKSSNKVSNYTIFTKGNKIRLETKATNSRKIVILNDGEKNFLYDPEAKQARYIPNFSSFTAFGIPAYTPEKQAEIKDSPKEPSSKEPDETKEESYVLGEKASKNGYPCQMLIDSAQNIQICLTEKFGLPAYLKKGDTIFNYKDIKMLKEEDSLFSLPKDVVIIRSR